MRLGPMTRKWLVTILIVLAVLVIGVLLYTAWAQEEVEPEVAEDERVSMVVGALRAA